MSGHTKGPWEFGEGYVPGASTFDLFGLGGRQVIASASYENMWLSRYDKDEDAANACLIAAAPCLKSALEDLLDAIGTHDPDWAWQERQNARAALLRASAAEGAGV